MEGGKSSEIGSMVVEGGAERVVGNGRDGRAAVVMAARRGGGDVLPLLRERGVDPQFAGVDKLISACALADQALVQSLIKGEPSLLQNLLAEGGTLLPQFAGVGNREGVISLR